MTPVASPLPATLGAITVELVLTGVNCERWLDRHAIGSSGAGSPRLEDVGLTTNVASTSRKHEHGSDTTSNGKVERLIACVERVEGAKVRKDRRLERVGVVASVKRGGGVNSQVGVQIDNALITSATAGRSLKHTGSHPASVELNLGNLVLALAKSSLGELPNDGSLDLVFGSNFSDDAVFEPDAPTVLDLAASFLTCPERCVFEPCTRVIVCSSRIFSSPSLVDLSISSER